MNRSEKIRLIYGIVLSALTVAVGIAFIAEVADLYYGALAQGITPIYTGESISKRLVLPLVLLFVLIAAAIVGYVLSVVYPARVARKVSPDQAKLLRRLEDRLPLSGADGFDEIRKELTAKHKIRICVWGVACAVIAACAIGVAVYVFDPANYHDAASWRTDILALVRHIIIWVAVGLACAIGAVVYDTISIKREITLVKKAIALGDRTKLPRKETVKKNFALAATGAAALAVLTLIALFIMAPAAMTGIVFPAVSGDGRSPSAAVVIATAILFALAVVACLALLAAVRKYVPQKADKIMLLCSRVAVGVVAISFIIAGALNGGAQDVLIKAINICTECIGLG